MVSNCLAITLGRKPSSLASTSARLVANSTNFASESTALSDSEPPIKRNQGGASITLSIVSKSAALRLAFSNITASSKDIELKRFKYGAGSFSIPSTDTILFTNALGS